MKAEISSIIGPMYESYLGNILGPQGFGWSNLYPQWFLDGPNTLGTPTMFNYRVHHFEGGQPFFSQPPLRKQTLFGSFLHPVADSIQPPPLSNLSEGYTG